MSFHKYGDLFFPGTGDIKDTREQYGKHYSVNVPLRDGIDDVTFLNIFRPVMSKVGRLPPRAWRDRTDRGGLCVRRR